MSGNGRLTEGFRRIIEMRWSEFVALEQDFDSTNFDAIITSLARAASKGNLRAIRVALDRLDGKIATEIDVEYPKFYTLYPYATKTADDPGIIDVNEGKVVKSEPISPPLTKNDGIVVIGEGAPADIDEQTAADEELPTGSLRAVLNRMLDSPKDIVNQILAAAQAIDDDLGVGGDPSVKSVMVAGLMKLVHDGKIGAVFEVFDQIDGKVAEKFKLLGNDVFITRFDTIAPAGATKNADGIYQIEADNTTSVWAARLEQVAKSKR